jgi:hypothetical protein
VGGAEGTAVVGTGVFEGMIVGENVGTLVDGDIVCT